MAANKQLQRRTGRRTSLPASPIFLDRRSGDRSFRPDSNSPQDNGSAIIPESPSFDQHMSSPNIELSSLHSPASATGYDDTHDTVWERIERSRSRPQEESNNSSPVSTSLLDGNHARSSRFQQPDSTFRSSPLTSSYKDGSDFGGRLETRERFYERSNASARNFSTTSLVTERSANEDPGRTPTPKKSRLNLLNPMSLLARRRSSQNSKLEDLNIVPLHAPAIPDFDPSIRGKIVHDFSTPRQRTPRRDAFPSPAPPPATSSPAMYSPVFKEHFQEEDRILQPTQTAYLHNKQLDAPTPQSMPAFAKRLPTRLPSDSIDITDKAEAPEIPHPNVPPPPPPKGTPSPVLDVPMSNQIPKHMKSTSSRFSFQMAGHGSAAQEKILEDKHREHFPKNPANIEEVDDVVEDDYDDYDPDMLDDFEGEIGLSGLDDNAIDFTHESIPIRNIEIQTSQRQLARPNHENSGDTDAIQCTNSAAQETRLRPQAQAQSTQSDAQHPGLQHVTVPDSVIQDFHFTPHSSALSPTSTRYGSEPTPRDAEGFPIGIANTAYSPATSRSDALGHQLQELSEPLFFEGLKISTIDNVTSSHNYNHNDQTFDDADLYFDDGEFDGEFNGDAIGTAEEFDESMLDDGSSYIRDIPAENARRYQAALESSGFDGEIAVVNHTTASTSIDSIRNVYDEDKQTSQIDHMMPTTKLPENIETKQSGLTEDNLAAYHDALALAANKAEANGRFNRQVSFGEPSEHLTQPMYDGGQTSFIPDQQRYSLDVGNSAPTDDDGFGFDDEGLDDDLMIAEANAEALENDDDGFYGQEFGFYARAHGKEPSDFMNGGYFASRGQNGIKRSHSGKATFQEPSLTPITEKSEWSARNSIASLPLHAGMPISAQSIPSPGLSQLLDSPLLEDDMTLSALMKLRRGTFGGSSTSINSLGERSLPNSSPLAHVSHHKFPSPAEPGHSRNISTTQSIRSSASIVESSEEDDEYGDRDTLTHNTPRKKVAGLMPQTPQEQIALPLMTHSLQPGKKGHHSRNSSGAESVSYTQDNIGRWILERRRTGDDGELEVIGREYLAGARI